MKIKRQVLKTEIKSHYFNSIINENDEDDVPHENDASNSGIAENIFIQDNDLLTIKSESEVMHKSLKLQDMIMRDQEIASMKRTGKISKYFKSNKKRIKKGDNPKFNDLLPLTYDKHDIKFNNEIDRSEMEIIPEKRFDDDVEQDQICTDNLKSSGKSKLPTMEEAKKAASVTIHYKPKFIPMSSPFNLVQETLYYDPWKLLIATMFLNRTRGSQALPLMWKFFEEYPSPQKAVLANVDKLSDLLRPLGLQNTRAERIIRFSYTYLLNPDFKTPKQLFGMGKYAEDSWKLFCEKDDNWMEEYGLETEDKILQLYVNWRRHQHKGLINEEDLEERNLEEKGISPQGKLQDDSMRRSPESIQKKYENENYLSLQELNNLDISSRYYYEDS
ncbi:6273_t:CDS:2 [Funneliformis geosporum]|uniref:Methyl-CpG-binding domain protein 4 n=1 Tax=Funneliformis geosporum TaxID=1117311 RepID=A0A9W4SJ67_9GLOM|nr:3012_t:CDS:2 [Funneliformis geosporum]CAI2171070.1 6273_t:CDS:2 [Funneliformis geosporum]